MNLCLPPDFCTAESCHEFVVCILSRFSIARPLTLSLFGFLQFIVLTVHQFNILRSKIDCIHDEFVDFDNRKCNEIQFTMIVCMRESLVIIY